MEEIKIISLTGVTGFLNGQEGLHEREEMLSELFKEAGKAIMIIDNLFEEKEKLMQVLKCDNLVLSTTGLYAEKLKPLMKAFEKMKYAPKAVIFMGENTAMYFLGIARDMKKKHQTKFYFPDLIDEGNLMEINWI